MRSRPRIQRESYMGDYNGLFVNGLTFLYALPARNKREKKVSGYAQIMEILLLYLYKKKS